MQVERLPDPAVACREYDRYAVDDDTEVADQPGVEYSVEICRLGTSSFPQSVQCGPGGLRQTLGAHVAYRTFRTRRRRSTGRPLCLWPPIRDHLPQAFRRQMKS